MFTNLIIGLVADVAIVLNFVETETIFSYKKYQSTVFNKRYLYD